MPSSLFKEEKVMKNSFVVALVVGASFVTLVLSVVISVNFITIPPEQLANVIKKDPVTFMNAVKVSSERYQKVAQEKQMKERFKNPAKIDVTNRVTFGDVKAPVTIVEYSDFQCPYCARASKTMKDLIKKYDGKVKVVYKHFPLGFHPLAKPAAVYFEAIAKVDQKKAKKFHDMIFDNFQDYARLKDKKQIDKKLQALVKKTGADLSQVEKVLEQAEAQVEKDRKEAESLQVRGTPTFFINGVKPGPDGFEPIIEHFLKKL